MTIINPGSHIPDKGGPENHYDVAVAEARRWLAAMHANGFPEVILDGLPPVESADKGRWTFLYRHTTTNVTATLEAHGVTEAAANTAGLIFGAPRIYWQGGSSSEPKPSDWLPKEGGWTWSYHYERSTDTTPPDPNR
jgi:hypothetical protein